MKLRYKILFLLSLLLSINILNADCESASKSGEDIIYSIQRATISGGNSEIYFFMFTDEVYFEVTNDYDDTLEKITYADTNDESYIKIISPNSLINVKYKISSYYSDKTCGEDIIKTIEVETGVYNKNVDNEKCTDKYYLDVCKENYSAEEYEKYKDLQSEEDLSKKIEEEEKEYNKKNGKSNLDIIKEYYLYVLIPVAIISVFYIVRIVFIKKRKEEKDVE